MRKELFSPLRIYTTRNKRFRSRRDYANDNVDYQLISPGETWLPWIFLRTPSTNLVTSIKVKSTSDDSDVFTLTNASVIASVISYFELRNSSGTVTDNIIFYKGEAVSGLDLDTGMYYLEIEDAGANKVYSEDFCVVADVCEYIRISWLNSTDLDYFPYSEGFFHHVYVDSDLIEEEPIYSVEETQNGMNESIEVFHSVTKRYKLKTDLLPPYLADAFSLIPLHDTVTLSKPDLPVHVEGSVLKNITLEGEWVTKMAYDGVLSFRLESIVKTASSENLNLNSLITSETTYGLRGTYASSANACNDVGTLTESDYYSEDSTIIVGSLIYQTSGNNETPITAEGWYFDETNGKSYYIGTDGIVDTVFACLTEMTVALVGEEATSAAACESTAAATTFYTEDETVTTGTVLYTTSQINTSYAADGYYMQRGTDNIYRIEGGAGEISTSGSQCSETTHALTSGFTDHTDACDGASSPTNYYSRDAVLEVGSVVYTTSMNNISYAPTGYYKDAVNDQSIYIASDGLVNQIVDCTETEFSHSVIGSESSSVDACNSLSSPTTVYSTDPTLIVTSVVYTISGNPTSYLGNGFYKLGTDYIEITGGSGEITDKDSCAI